jgi:hypothetical protein
MNSNTQEKTIYGKLHNIEVQLKQLPLLNMAIAEYGNLSLQKP